MDFGHIDAFVFAFGSDDDHNIPSLSLCGASMDSASEPNDRLASEFDNCNEPFAFDLVEDYLRNMSSDFDPVPDYVGGTTATISAPEKIGTPTTVSANPCYAPAGNESFESMQELLDAPIERITEAYVALEASSSANYNNQDATNLNPQTVIQPFNGVFTPAPRQHAAYIPSPDASKCEYITRVLSHSDHVPPFNGVRSSRMPPRKRAKREAQTQAPAKNPTRRRRGAVKGRSWPQTEHDYAYAGAPGSDMENNYLRSDALRLVEQVQNELSDMGAPPLPWAAALAREELHPAGFWRNVLLHLGKILAKWPQGPTPSLSVQMYAAIAHKIRLPLKF